MARLDDLRMNLTQVKAVAADHRRGPHRRLLGRRDRRQARRHPRQAPGRHAVPPGRGGGGPLPPKVIDIKEDPALIERKQHAVKLEGLQLAAYRNRVEKVLRDLFETNETLQRIKRGQPVSDSRPGGADLAGADPGPDARPERPGGLLSRDAPAISTWPSAASSASTPTAVAGRFTAFVQQHPTLNSAQIRFLDLLQNHIAKYGSIEVARLYEPPFTTLHTDSLDGLFPTRTEVEDLHRDHRILPAATDRKEATSHDYRHAARTRSTSSGPSSGPAGITNPLTVIEQISFLMFARLLDIAETRDEKRAARTGQAVQGALRPRAAEAPLVELQEPGGRGDAASSCGTRCSRTSASSGDSGSTFAEYMNDAQLLIQKPSLLVSAVNMIDDAAARPRATPRATSTSTCSAS